MANRPAPATAGVAEHWTVDKRVPLALILSIIGSTLSVGGTAVIAHYRLGTVESRVDRLETSDRQQDRDSAARDRVVAETMAELRSTVLSLREAVSELRTTLRQTRQ